MPRRLAYKRQPTSDELDDLLFAWKVCKTVKSNAILVAKDRMGLGMGPGQPNRVDAALLACERANKLVSAEDYAGWQLQHRHSSPLE